jgi:16S rRNA C967 or C1407 C5-methylase (RsmB/RsmF family)
VRENVMPPVEFVRSPEEHQVEDARVEQRTAYDEYVQAQAAEYLEKRFGSEEYERLIEAKGREVKQQYRVAETWSKEQLREVAEGLVRRQVAGEAPVMGFEEFCKTAVTSD